MCWWPLTRLLITDEGVYDDVCDDRYHADPVLGGSLSSTGARKLLPPGCPAVYRHWRATPSETADHFDLGHAAHALVLGAGQGIDVIDAPDWRTKAAREGKAAAHAAGRTPLLAHQYERVEAMAWALSHHDTAGALLDGRRGRPEVTLVWRDPKTQIMCRARYDFLPDRGPWRLIIPDYKTAAAVDLDSLQRAVAAHRYDQQSAWYKAAALALDLGDDATTFAFIFQAKEPPYLVTVVELDHVAMRLGAARNRQALDTLAWCQETGRWPDHTDGEIAQLSLPAWLENQEGANE